MLWRIASSWACVIRPPRPNSASGPPGKSCAKMKERIATPSKRGMDESTRRIMNRPTSYSRTTREPGKAEFMRHAVCFTRLSVLVLHEIPLLRVPEKAVEGAGPEAANGRFYDREL